MARNAILVYLFSFFVGSWGLIEEWSSWLPHRINAYNGFVSISMAYDRGSRFFFFAVFYPMLNGIPLMFSLWATFDILWKKKLPSSGKRREQAIYFFRIILVFLIMWVPGLFCFFVLGSVDPWYVVISAAWSHSQGAVSAAFSLLKPDIFQAFKNLLRCQCWQDDGRFSSRRFSSIHGARDASQQRSSNSRMTSFGSTRDSAVRGSDEAGSGEIAQLDSLEILEAGSAAPQESVPDTGEPRRGPLFWLTLSRLLMGDGRSLSKGEIDRARQDLSMDEPIEDEGPRGADTESSPSAHSEECHHAETPRTQTTEVDQVEAEQYELSSSDELGVPVDGVLSTDSEKGLDVDNSA